MSDISDLSDTIIAKSDQLNADDLLGMQKIITVTGVSRGSIESPITINYSGDNGRPFKPCKTVRKLILFAWGADGGAWVGRQMTVFTDPEVVYAGKKVGGIRISSMSGISKPFTVSLTETRGKKKDYKISVLQAQEKPNYPPDKFTAALPTMGAKVADGSMTSEQIITRCEQSGKLTDEQREQIRAFENDDINQFFNEGE
jgi:hypothetical protein